MHAHASLHDYARACRRKRDCASTLARHVTSSTFSAWSSVFTNDFRVYTDTKYVYAAAQGCVLLELGDLFGFLEGPKTLVRTTFA